MGEALLMGTHYSVMTAKGLSIPYDTDLENAVEIISREKRAPGRPSVAGCPRSPAALLRQCFFIRRLRDLGCWWSQGSLARRPRPDHEACYCRQGWYQVPAAARS